MEALLAEISKVASTADRTARRSAIDALRKLADSLEDSIGTTHRFGHKDLEKASIQLGYDLNIFKYLVQANGPKTVQEIAEQAAADPQLMSTLSA